MKFAIWNDEVYGDILFQFDDEGNFDDITPEGKEILESHGKNPYEWLGKQEYPLRYEEYSCRGTEKKDFEPKFKPRSPWKGRGKTEKPTCPHCGEDLRRSYEIKKCSTSKKPYGWHCKTCKHQEWD